MYKLFCLYFKCSLLLLKIGFNGLFIFTSRRLTSNYCIFFTSFFFLLFFIYSSCLVCLLKIAFLSLFAICLLPLSYGEERKRTRLLFSPTLCLDLLFLLCLRRCFSLDCFFSLTVFRLAFLAGSCFLYLSLSTSSFAPCSPVTVMKISCLLRDGGIMCSDPVVIYVTWPYRVS